MENGMFKTHGYALTCKNANELGAKIHDHMPMIAGKRPSFLHRAWRHGYCMEI
jgi:hypothetical protein